MEWDQRMFSEILRSVVFLDFPDFPVCPVYPVLQLPQPSPVQVSAPRRPVHLRAHEDHDVGGHQTGREPTLWRKKKLNKTIILTKY